MTEKLIIPPILSIVSLGGVGRERSTSSTIVPSYVNRKPGILSWCLLKDLEAISYSTSLLRKNEEAERLCNLQMKGRNLHLLQGFQPHRS